MSNFLYIRVSTKSQETSLQMQQDLCVCFLDKKAIKLNIIYSEVSSAYNKKQPILNNILDINKSINLYILNISRFSRNIINGMEMLEKAKSNNINIIFIEENLETNNNTNINIIRIKILEAQHESEVLSSRITIRNDLKRKRGEELGRPAFGKKLEYIKDIRKITHNIEEQHIIDFIIQARDGICCKKLNTKLQEINQTSEPIIFFDNDGTTEITTFKKKNTLNYQEIADLLNDYDIYKRGGKWTYNSVLNVYNSNNIFTKISKMTI